MRGAVRLVQPVCRARCEEQLVAGRERRAKQIACTALKTASACGTACGSDARLRRLQALWGRPRSRRPACRRRSERCARPRSGRRRRTSAAARLSAWPPTAALPRATPVRIGIEPCRDRTRDQAERDHCRARAEPALARDRSVNANDRLGRRERENARMARCDSSTGVPSPSRPPSRSRGDATAATSKPGPMFALVAGARTWIVMRRASVQRLGH